MLCGMPQWSKKIYEFYMLHEFTVVLFRKINVCIRCAFMTLNSLLDCDLPACSKNCIRWLNFLCGVVIVVKKICTVAWRDVCKSREEGGLAVKDPSLVNKAFLLHLCWKMLTSQDQWAVTVRMRFMKNGKPRSSHLKIFYLAGS